MDPRIREDDNAKSMKSKAHITNTQTEHPGTLKSYVTGFILSIVLTIIPYFLVSNHLLSGALIVAIVIGFAFVQLAVQLLFFLHMREEAKPRLNLLIFISFASIILIVVVASIWIMQHLNYNMNLIQLNNEMKYGEGF
ncbi:MAG: cytochrome o ubiquinol oxidase subunit IV [Candidatus Levyibacteriota bacterium]